jgi:hypothetical protein
MMLPLSLRRLVPGFIALLGAFAGLLPSSVALADARVDVEVKDTSGRLATAQVTLSLGSVTKTCATVGGRCSLTVPAGRYQVRLVPSSGATVTSQVTVPASGAIRLALLVTPAPTQNTTGSTTKPAATTQAQAVTPSAARNLRDLSRGSRLLVQGSVMDPTGRLTNATITVQQNGRPIGRATCVGGRFNVYDLAAGKYTLLATAPNGTRATVALDVKTSLLRPTLRLTP